MLRHLFSQPKAQAQATTEHSVGDEDATNEDEAVWGLPQPGMEPEYSQYVKNLDGWRLELRVEFARGPGGFVRGWPSQGGFYVLGPCFGVELEFLGLDRFRNTPRPSISDPAAAAEEEDMHCNKMRQLGATWWKSKYEYIKNAIEPEPVDMVVTVGWPAGGGAWVLALPPVRARVIGIAIVHNAYNMEERCKAIEQLGGTFYENPKKCRFLHLP